jgi:hypothetical protein
MVRRPSTESTIMTAPSPLPATMDLRRGDSEETRVAVPVISRHDGLAVIDEPGKDGFGIAVESAELSLHPVRYGTAEQAAAVAEQLAPLADWSALATDAQRMAVLNIAAVNRDVRAIMHSAEGAIIPPAVTYNPLPPAHVS